MDNVLRMKVFDGVEYLQHIVFDLALCESFFSFEEVVEGLNESRVTLLVQSSSTI